MTTELPFSPELFNEQFIPPELLKDGISPFPYQWVGAMLLTKKLRFLLADDPGLGKTIQIIVAINMLQKFKGHTPLRVLILCPKSMLITWPREIRKWSLGSTEFKVINHDKLIGKAGKELMKKWDIVVADESHMYIKNIDTQRAKAFLILIQQAERVWLSTATPASKGGDDYFVTLKVLLPKIFDKWSKSAFMRRYCKKVPDKWAYCGFRYEGFNNTAELKKVFEACSIRRKQEEVKADLPELTFTDYFADVDYKDLMHFTEHEAADIKKRIMEGESFGAHYQAQMKHNALLKVPSVLELLNTYPADKKVVIFAWHRTVVNKIVTEIEKETDRKVAYITGEINSATERQDIIDNFQTGELNTLVLNMQSGGVGITLTAATVGIYVQYPYSATHWTQSIKRIHRIGSKEPVQIVKVMIEQSIDEDIFSILQERLDYIREVGV